MLSRGRRRFSHAQPTPNAQEENIYVASSCSARCVAPVCCTVWQYVAVRCSVLQCMAAKRVFCCEKCQMCGERNRFPPNAREKYVSCIVLQYAVVCRGVLQCASVYRTVLQFDAPKKYTVGENNLHQMRRRLSGGVGPLTVLFGLGGPEQSLPWRFARFRFHGNCVSCMFVRLRGCVFVHILHVYIYMYMHKMCVCTESLKLYSL